MDHGLHSRFLAEPRNPALTNIVDAKPGSNAPGTRGDREEIAFPRRFINNCRRVHRSIQHFKNRAYQ
jgi:hypothetical protein